MFVFHSEGEDMSESQTSINPEQLIDISGKLPFDTEVTTILTAKLEMIKQPMAIFIRLEEAAHLGDMAEVSCPVRFICLIAGPPLGTTTDYFQLGRCLGTLMSDSQFLTLAYCMQVSSINATALICNQDRRESSQPPPPS